MIALRRATGALWRHPILTLVFSICIIGGITMTIIWSPENWGLTRQVLGGLFAGAGTGFLVTAPNLFEEVSEEVLEGHENEVRSLKR